MTKVPLSTVEDTYRLLPEGTYDAVVTNVLVEAGEDNAIKNPGGNHKWRVEFEVTPDDGKGIVKVTKTMTWYDKALKFAWKDLCTITGENIPLNDMAVDDEEDTHLVMGRSVRLVLRHFQRSDGSEMNTVDSIRRPGTSETVDATAAGKGKKSGKVDLSGMF